MHAGRERLASTHDATAATQRAATGNKIEKKIFATSKGELFCAGWFQTLSYFGSAGFKLFWKMLDQLF
jgi:hypothetical protein